MDPVALSPKRQLDILSSLTSDVGSAKRELVLPASHLTAQWHQSPHLSYNGAESFTQYKQVQPICTPYCSHDRYQSMVVYRCPESNSAFPSRRCVFDGTVLGVHAVDPPHFQPLSTFSFPSNDGWLEGDSDYSVRADFH